MRSIGIGSRSATNSVIAQHVREVAITITTVRRNAGHVRGLEKRDSRGQSGVRVCLRIIALCCQTS